MALPYWGGKARIAQEIADIIIADADDMRDEYLEPFAGMASVACVCARKRNWKRMCLNDSNEQVAEYLNALCNTEWEPGISKYPSVLEWQALKKAP